jgi:hypothetical protein
MKSMCDDIWSTTSDIMYYFPGELKLSSINNFINNIWLSIQPLKINIPNQASQCSPFKACTESFSNLNSSPDYHKEVFLPSSICEYPCLSTSCLLPSLLDTMGSTNMDGRADKAESILQPRIRASCIDLVEHRYWAKKRVTMLNELAETRPVGV